MTYRLKIRLGLYRYIAKVSKYPHHSCRVLASHMLDLDQLLCFKAKDQYAFGLDFFFVQTYSHSYSSSSIIFLLIIWIYSCSQAWNDGKTCKSCSFESKSYFHNFIKACLGFEHVSWIETILLTTFYFSEEHLQLRSCNPSPPVSKWISISNYSLADPPGVNRLSAESMAERWQSLREIESVGRGGFRASLQAWHSFLNRFAIKILCSTLKI